MLFLASYQPLGPEQPREQTAEAAVEPRQEVSFIQVKSEANILISAYLEQRAGKHLVQMYGLLR